ncbi:hypothetical protein [Fictibacillus sp. BK138]|uniref:hypothetical protein n=1 Tax=Fictibacillus sp. BK138 TaxID=2512121 RepID=UPI001028E96B|nr:hypothetical protein [Fictibacillus sp. BK138]RZT23591.1 hypothetical protein EV282_2684 [Fictibacillus sp. BK138]
MSIIQDIQLYIPKHEDLNWKFFHETRAITSLYSSLLPKLHTKEVKGIQIYCVESIDEKKQIDTFDHIIFEYFPVYVETDVEAFLALTSDSEKKKHTLEIVHEGMKKAAQAFNWDLRILEEIYYKIKQADYKNIFPLLKKSSQNKKYVCHIMCHHEVSSIDVYLEVKKRNGSVVNSEKLFSVENTDEQDLFSDYGILQWKLNHKVEFADKDYKKVYRLTFLEKDKPEDLVWKIVNN